MFLHCQSVINDINADSLPAIYFGELKKEYGNHKRYPAKFEKQILIALSYYPELKDTPIRFREKRRHGSMNARATMAGVFTSKQNRSYVITISDSTEPILAPLLFKNVSFNAQVGVLGHELGHITDFSSMTTLQILKHVVYNVSSKYLDRFEYRTDSICIAHGLGYQLLEWSSHVRKAMNREYWGGPDQVHKITNTERYMNPGTIRKRMNENTLYNQKSEIRNVK